MNIAAALSHFEWRFRNHWKPTKKDLEAYNSILEWKELIEMENMSQNESLAKLWIHQFLLLAWAQKLDSKDAIIEIDSILKRSVYDWVLRLQKDIPLLKLHLTDLDNPINDAYSFTEMQTRNEKIVAQNHDQMLNDFLDLVDEKNLIKFVSDQITRVINIFEK